MSTPFDQKGPAQPNDVEHEESEPNKGPVPGKSDQAKKDDRKLPGADGKNSAGANEDTYD
ncbi:MAG TPA: hypothetical protein VGN60_08905 [Devosia sp.]|jgi:hypothetical protein|nr:hypothetical protein [Devosia sp.]